MRLVDVRHEQTAVFAAEATARLTRTPGLAVVTAGPGVTNCGQRGDHRLVQRRAASWCSAAGRPTTGGARAALQEMDHPPLLAPVTKRAWTEHDTAQVAASVDEAFRARR